MSGKDKFAFVFVEVTGDRPLLMARMDVDLLLNAGTTSKRDKTAPQLTTREIAQKLLYADATGRLYFPTTGIARMLREAGGAHKMRGERKSVKYKVPAAVLLMQDEMFLHHPDTGKPIVDPNWEVDVRSGVNSVTKARIPICRPRIERWATKFQLRINQDVLPEELIHRLLDDAGEQLGLGAFRPERGGTFGLFRVTKWQKEIKKTEPEEVPEKAPKKGKNTTPVAAE